MKRRALLALTGAAMTGVAGCLAGSSPTGPTNGDDLPTDPEPADGIPPTFEQTPESQVVDPAGFETVTVEGTDVPLAPIDVVYYWYARGDARFVDARGPSQYRQSHIYGAVLSPAPTGFPEDDPVSPWPRSDRIVCYCGCPHHLSSLRGAALMANDYRDVYVIDEGFWEWHDRSYPMAGGDVQARPSVEVIDGIADPGFAGQSAWGTHPASGQMEATAIQADGSYQLHLRFADVSPDSVIQLETPGYTVRAPLSELTTSVVTGL